MPSIDTKTIALLALPAILVLMTQWLLSRSTSSPPAGALDTDEKEDITERVPLARREDLRGDVVVKKIYIHPIKSFKGISMNEARYTLTGLDYDRVWAVIDVDANRIVTARDIPRMVLVRPEILPDPNSPYGGILRATFPETEALGVEGASFEIPLEPTEEMMSFWETLDEISMLAWGGFDALIVQPVPGSPSPHDLISQYLGRRVVLAMKGPRPRAVIPCANFPELGTETMPAHVAFQDIYPIMLASEESLAETGRRVRLAAATGAKGVAPAWATGEREFVIERFRPNIVLEGAGVPFAEDAWEEIAFTRPGPEPTSSPMIRLVSKCTRCIFPNIDPKTAVRDNAVPFNVLAQFRKGLEDTFASRSAFGVHGVPSEGGIVRVGDRITTLKWYGDA